MSIVSRRPRGALLTHGQTENSRLNKCGKSLGKVPKKGAFARRIRRLSPHQAMVTTTILSAITCQAGKPARGTAPLAHTGRARAGNARYPSATKIRAAVMAIAAFSAMAMPARCALLLAGAATRLDIGFCHRHFLHYKSFVVFCRD